MSTFTNLLFHIVYSTKFRKPTIEKTWEDDLFGYVGGIIRENNTNEAVALFSWARVQPWARAHGYNIPPRWGFGRGVCPVFMGSRPTMGSRPWLQHAVPLGLNTAFGAPSPRNWSSPSKKT